MRGRIRARLERLEEQAGADPSGFDWRPLAPGETFLWPEDGKTRRREALERHPALAVLRREWTRLGVPDAGEYEGIDVIEEAIRLVGMPTPTTNEATNEPTTPEA